MPADRKQLKLGVGSRGSGTRGPELGVVRRGARKSCSNYQCMLAVETRFRFLGVE